MRLEEYGAEAEPLRRMLRASLGPVADSIWHTGSAIPDKGRAFRLVAGGDVILRKLEELSPQNAAQRSLQARTLQIGSDMAQTRLLIFSGQGYSISMPFLFALILWLAAIFGSFGVFARPNATVVAVLLFCAHRYRVRFF